MDGCQRSDALNLGVSTPEWVYVDRPQVLAARAAGYARAGARTVEGVVTESRPAGEDLYINHDFNDIDVAVLADSCFTDLLASADGDELGTEWEAVKIPTWAWPQTGDRVRESGSWIWDCGHWGNSAADPTGLSQFAPYDPVETGQDVVKRGAIIGEQTELHPLYEVATFRKDAAGLLAGQPSALSRLDVWINGDGGPALAEEECALLGIQNSVAARLLCPQVRDVGGPYSYVLPLGPKPVGSTIVVNPVEIHSETDSELIATTVTLVPDETAGNVGVSFTLPGGGVKRHFGITVEAGWSGATPAVHHVVTLDSIHIEKSLDGASEPNHNPAYGNPAHVSEITPDPGEWVLYANVSGHWQQIPGISQVTDNQTITPGTSFDFYLPLGVSPTLLVAGRECDVPLIDCTREAFDATPAPIPMSTELGFNDHPGRIENGTAGVVMTSGTDIYRPAVNPDPASGNEDLSDNICGPNACYQVTATSSIIP